MVENHELSDEALDRPAVSALGICFFTSTKGPETALELSDEALDRPQAGGALTAFSGSCYR